MTELEHRTPEQEWNAWGTAEGASPVGEEVRTLLEQFLGVVRRDTPSVDRPDVRVGASQLSDEVRTALAAIVGEDGVRTDDHTRLLHAGGKSTPDLLRRRAGEAESAPDAVVLPASHAQVGALLALCAERRVAVVPFGGGTSVVGGVEPERGGFDLVIALDLRLLDELVEVDAESRTATLQAGLRGPEAEELLGKHGFTLGHFPQSFEHASIGGFAATRSSGQASSGYGRFDDMVQRLRVATPNGELDLGRGPGSAAGPDLRQLFLGSEGALGIITEVTVRVHPKPQEVESEAWSFPDFATGAKALRALAQNEALPTVARLSDEAETMVNLASAHSVGAGEQSGGCLMITRYEGNRIAGHARTSELLAASGGTSLGAEAAEQWSHGRYHGPYLRDALLDVNAVVETLETASTWSKLTETCDAVRGALTESLEAQGTPPLVMCHISHVYPTGASLYFTVAFARGEDPRAQWWQAKRAVGDAIVRSGATITHHHAVGTDHRAWMTDEIGDLGVAVLRAVKSTVDPSGVLNPGKLIP
ncbi:FAD-binding oxidoreductase [Saccharopolyspora dendranthemae]|uniref:Alkyldihydroxyacetonephosphate synthase n=1 Tax=Saccharopolyspora dendranthemae TaxID=1181886 RepID=A0A561VAD8_9PSEU|nr:FAD-binding oxidoreductase [Saccharopolyspora dendranthemae]TWG08593.1 alkyldihydroxyacetonephosphate synthase [Saccharopolyspora dendranthemae]